MFAAAGDGLALDEGKLAHPQRDGLLAEHGGEVAREVFRGGVVGADHDEGPGSPRPQRGGQIGPMDGSQPGNERGKPSALRQGGEGGGFPMMQDLIKKDVHAEEVYHLSRGKSIAARIFPRRAASDCRPALSSLLYY